MRKTGILSAATIAFGACAFAGMASAEPPVAGKAPAVAPAISAPTGAAITPSTTPATAETLSDSQLKSYVGAQRELTVLNTSAGGGLSNPTPDTQAQMAAILQRYSIDGQTYNAISAKAKTDKKLAERLASLKVDSTVKTQ